MYVYTTQNTFYKYIEKPTVIHNKQITLLKIENCIRNVKT